ncbi:MAG: TonB-dependent receptor, partial [Akkermansiaceae bacterium]|nr:TonB-dependent receptor [Akkermansiaceae bacterium]
GETNEHAGYVNGTFLRRRRAGGEQFFGGVFARAAYHPESDLTLDASARLDFWGLRDGERVEHRPSTGALLRDDQFHARDGLEPSLSVAVSYPVTESVTLAASSGTSFRLPTLNELYRPFRVRNDITEANAGLDPERFFSIEAGARWTPSDAFSCSLDFFHHWINDAIANVPVTDPGEATAIAGFVPPGGSVAQRRNVEEARAWGLEGRAHWQVSPRCALTLSYLLSRSEFEKSSDQPLLEGKRFPQAPLHRLVAGIESSPL